MVSPVYQEVQRHEPPGGTGLCLLLTGLWFDHHFSAAVSLAADPAQPDVFTIDFDVADRCRAPIESLAATYVLGLDSGALAEASPGRIAWNLDGPSPGRLELLADSPCSLVLAEAGQAGDARASARGDPAGELHPPVALPMAMDQLRGR